MIRRACSGFVLIALLAGGGSADENLNKGGPALRPAELRCADGSVLRVQVFEANLDVETRYGKQTVPISDVRKIEFGPRMSSEVARKFRQALETLDSDDLQEREAAGRQLIDLGRVAYPGLLRSMVGTSAEKSRRIDALVKNIKQRVPAADLATSEEDLVHTASFVVVGRLLTPRLKLRTALFGDTELRLTDLYALQFRDAGGVGTHVRVDAAKYGVAGNVWMDTGILIEAGDRLEITATGKVTCTGADFKGSTGPAGKKEWAPKDSPFPAGALLGRIGTSGMPFLIGARSDVAVPRKTRFWIRIAPFRVQGEAPEGVYDVQIIGGRPENPDAAKP
jgi:hypothetical protein